MAVGILDADGGSTLEPEDVVAISGPRGALVGSVEAVIPEVDDPLLLDVPVTMVDVFVRSKAVNGRTLRELADEPYTRGVYLRKIMRNMVEIPVLPETEILRGDILTIGGSTRNVDTAVAAIGHADRPTESTDLAVVAAGILAGGLIGALSFGWGGIPISLSTSGGALLAGLILGYLRTVHPTFGNIPRAGALAHEYAGSERVHRYRGHQRRAGIRFGSAAGGLEHLPLGNDRHRAAADCGGADRISRLQVSSCDTVRRLRGRAHDNRGVGNGPGSGKEQGTRARLRDALRDRQHGAHDLRHGDRPADDARCLTGIKSASAGGELMDIVKLREYEALSPFEIKDFLAKAATSTSAASAIAYLNAGRGNPNWIATEPREAFFLLGQFAITESKRVLDLPPGVGGMPQARGIADRLAAWLKEHEILPGSEFLGALVPWSVAKFGFDADRFVHELVDSIIGDNYPVPDRMLVHNEQIVHEYLQWAMCGPPRPEGRFHLYAVEGGTAAMCYIFKSMKTNRLLNAGDTIALATPIFTPYLEMPHLEDYDLKIVSVQMRQESRFQFDDAELKKLLDPAIKAFFVVNPGNPSAVALSEQTITKIGAILKKRPELILLTDDVYGTFVPGFRSLLGAYPHNTIGVYSYSKYFGCTGWRLGVIAVHEDNLFDRLIAKHPEPVLKKLDKRYGALTLEPRKLRFIDRIVADSRDVALNHTAGLSLPQQVMMSLFSLYELMDEKKHYQKACIGIVRKRVEATIEGLGIEVAPNQNFDWYYGLIDFEFWARKYVGEDVVRWMKDNVHPLDIVFRLAEDHGIVLLNGSGFDAPDWSVRVSFANLDDHVYDDIGRAIRAVARSYRQAYEASKAKPAARKAKRKRAAPRRAK